MSHHDAAARSTRPLAHRCRSATPGAAGRRHPLEPLILSPVLQLHPFAVILAVTAGAVTSGALGAFLAVPMAAILARVVEYLRGHHPAAGPGSKPDDDTPAWG